MYATSVCTRFQRCVFFLFIETLKFFHRSQRASSQQRVKQSSTHTSSLQIAEVMQGVLKNSSSHSMRIYDSTLIHELPQPLITKQSRVTLRTEIQ